jgi:hypothetical protein
MVRKRSEDIVPGHDELELLEAMLNDKYVNHGLDKILKEVQIVLIQEPENYGEYPGIRLYGGQWAGSQIAQEPDEDGEFVDILQKHVTVQIYIMENQEVKYGGVVYKGTRILTLIRDILVRIFSEQEGYPLEGDEKNVTKFSDVRIDYIQPQTESWDPNYLGQNDAIALNLGIFFSYEKRRL